MLNIEHYKEQRFIFFANQFTPKLFIMMARADATVCDIVALKKPST